MCPRQGECVCFSSICMALVNGRLGSPCAKSLTRHTTRVNGFLARPSKGAHARNGYVRVRWRIARAISRFGELARVLNKRSIMFCVTARDMWYKCRFVYTISAMRASLSRYGRARRNPKIRNLLRALSTRGPVIGPTLP